MLINIKNAKDNNDNWHKNQEETQLLTNELKHLKSRLSENKYHQRAI